ncbi:MAG: hypothetical protein AAFR46_16155 [Pseudomonadota bacterium]
MTETHRISALTQAFERHQIDAARFHHAEHVRVAVDLLRKYDFVDAVSIYAKGVRSIAAQAGAPEKVNLTITYAFISLIAERLSRSPWAGWEAFADAHPDLLRKQALQAWYSEERLHSDIARRMFLLPDRSGHPAV